MTEEMVFDDLELKQIPVTIGKRKFVLTEASGAAVTAWRNAQLKGTRLGPDMKPAGLDGIADAEPLLVSRCLYYAGDKGELRMLPPPHQDQPNPVYLVSQATISSWRHAIQQALYDRVMEVSGLAAKDKTESNGAEDSAKNLPNGTPDGSCSATSSS